MTKNPRNKLLLHACPRCAGDLFPELDENDVFACLQCGRRIPAAQLTSVAAPAAVLASAA
jgi:hypothetical protein